MASKLVALRGPLAGKNFELADAALTLGRGTDNTVVIASKEASRNHAQIRREGARYMLVDLGSSNGTFVDGQQVQTRLLEAGDEITIGEEAFRFEAMPDAPPMRLIALQGPLAGQHFDLGGELLTIGRSVTSTVVIANKEASRNHAQIRREGEGYALVDQGSSNGTFVNGQQVQTHQLRHGDRIAIGDEIFGFEELAATVVPATPPPARPAPPPTPPPARPAAPTPPPVATPTPRPESGPALPKQARNTPPAAKASYGIKCPVCNRVIEPHHQHCPWDGASLANGQTVFIDPPAGGGKS